MKLIVVIADVDDFIAVQEPVKHRSVQIDLTQEQIQKLKLRHENESYSMSFFEE